MLLRLRRCWNQFLAGETPNKTEGTTDAWWSDSRARYAEKRGKQTWRELQQYYEKMVTLYINRKPSMSALDHCIVLPFFRIIGGEMSCLV
jgi:hypothetical protein